MDKIKIGLNPDGTPRMLTIDSTLRRELDQIKPRVTKGGWDYFALAAGIPGSGKSTLMRTTVAPYLAKTLEDIYIVFDADEFIKVSNECPENSVIIIDEGFADWNSRQSTRNEFLKLVNHAQLIRQKHLFILICLPNFFDLSKTIAIFRSSHLFVTYANNKGHRGSFLAFGRDKKRELFIRGSKYMDYNCVRCNFVGNFRMNKGLMDDEAYERQKKRHLLLQGKEFNKPNEARIDRAKFLTDNTIINLKKRGFKQKEMAEVLGISVDTVCKHWSQLKRDRKIPPDLLI